MHWFRSSLLIAIVSLFVLTGYTHAVMDQCCSNANEKQEQTQGDPSVPMNDDGCQCICHQVPTVVSTAHALLPSGVRALQMSYFSSDEFPPDALPKGVEVPPQII